MTQLKKGTKLTSSVIIPTRNRCSDIILCLYSLTQQIYRPDEIIIVDSSNVPIYKRKEFFNVFHARYFGKTKLCYIYCAEPGLPRQRNQAIQKATGDILYFFDDDVILEPDYLEHMQQIFEQHPEYAGGMGSVTNIPEQKKNIFWLVKKMFGLQQIYASGGFTWSGMPLHAYGKTAFQEVEVLGGCCMAYRASVCHTKLFDEQLGRYAYMEDADAAWRVSRSYKLFYNPRARLKHMVSPQARDRLVDTRALYIKNYSYLFFKNVYSKNKLKIVAYAWTVLGLFCEACLLRSSAHMRGYVRGLCEFYRK